MTWDAVRLTTSDRGTKQTSHMTEEYIGILRKYEYYPDVVSRDLENVFFKTSANRSCFFFNYSKNDRNHWYGKGKPEPLAFYGVKGVVPIPDREARYVEQFACERDMLKGNGFSGTVINTPYIEHDQTADIQDIEELKKTVGGLGRSSIKQNDINNDYKLDDAKKVLSRILGECDGISTTPIIVIFLDNAETYSLPFLGMIYDYLPFTLRNQLGFMTNVDVHDVEKIDEAKIGVHIMTMDACLKVYISSDFDEEGQWGGKIANVLYIDAREPYLDLLNNKRTERYTNCIDFLHLLGKIDEKRKKEGSDFSRLFDHAEKRIESERHLIKLGDYCDIATILLDELTIFYNDESIDTWEELITKSKEQHEFWSEEEDRKYALWMLYTAVLKRNKLNEKLSNIISNDDYEGRTEILEYCKDSFELGFFIEPLESMDRFHKEAEKSLEDKNKKNEDQINRLEAEKGDLEKEKTEYLSTNKDQEQKIKNLETLRDNYVEAETNLKEALRKKQTELDEYKEKFEKNSGRHGFRIGGSHNDDKETFGIRELTKVVVCTCLLALISIVISIASCSNQVKTNGEISKISKKIDEMASHENVVVQPIEDTEHTMGHTEEEVTSTYTDDMRGTTEEPSQDYKESESMTGKEE